jgi:hypothetical protein
LFGQRVLFCLKRSIDDAGTHFNKGYGVEDGDKNAKRYGNRDRAAALAFLLIFVELNHFGDFSHRNVPFKAFFDAPLVSSGPE